MKVKILFCMVFCCCSIDVIAKEMSFHIYIPCDGNGSRCSNYILAEGAIARDTPEKFIKFLKKNKKELYSPTIYLNSLGGHLIAGLELGEIIRKNKLNTYIGMAEHVNFKAKDAKKRYLTIQEKSICFSACAYAFLGGLTRDIDSNYGAYGIHQFYSKTERNTQEILSVLALYLDKMGVDRKLLDYASFTYKDDIYLLSPATARELNVINQGEKIIESWVINAHKSGKISTCSHVKQEDHRSLTSMCLINAGGVIKATIIYIVSSDYELNDVEKRFKSEESSGSELSIMFENYEVIAKEQTKWMRNKNVFIKTFLFDERMITGINLSDRFEVEAYFSNVNRHIDPSATFSTEGLGNQIKALLKN